MTENQGVLRIKIKRVHFVAIGGIGMSGIAEVLLTLGFEVTGSDIAENATTRRLRRLGSRIAIGHAAENVGTADVLVYSSAIKPDNPELIEARRLGIPVIRRAEMLAELMRLKEGIAIAGSHGKTTTTSLIAWILSEAGLDPTCLVGGRLESFDSNARLGQSRFLVAEADESDGSFLSLTPVLNVITNIDPEHLDHYGTFDKLVESFAWFAGRVPFYGMNVICADHPVTRELLGRITRRYVTYGLSPDAHFRASDIVSEGFVRRFVAWRGAERLGEVALPMPGLHNVQNALAAIACAAELEIPFEVVTRAISSFKGVDRRFQRKGVVGGITVIDDYAHHPSEIRASLKAARECFEGKVVALFQPHRYTRTEALFYEFTRAFNDCDELYVCDIYAASETPIPGVSSEHLANAIRDFGHTGVRYLADKDDAAAAAAATLKAGDALITLGAGDVKNAGLYALDLLNLRLARKES